MRQGKSKEQIVREIASILGFEAPRMSSGSTEPASLFVLVIDALGIGDGSQGTKQEMARKIVEASGEVWRPEFESRGGTITREGLLAVLDSVLFFTGGSR